MKLNIRYITIILLQYCLANTVYASRNDFQPLQSNTEQLVLSGNMVLNKPMIITKDIKVVSKSDKPVKIQTKGNIPAFIIKSKNVTFDGISFDGLNFVQIDRDMNSLNILNCQITDSKQTARGYMLTKTKEHIQIDLLRIQKSMISNLTPVFLNQVYVTDVQVVGNSFKNIIRYGIRIKNNSHAGEGASVKQINFSDNQVNGISPGQDRQGVARLLMLSANDNIVVRNNKIQNIQGVGQGGNILYISGPTSLNFSNNEVRNINGATFAIHDKGLRGNKIKNISNNVFTQLSSSKIDGIINIYQSSNYRIEQNIFEGLTSSAVRISNPRPIKGEDIPSNIVIAGNQFLSADNADIISVVQTVNYLTVFGNQVDRFYNKSAASYGREQSPRFVSLVATLDEANLADITIERNVINNVDNRFSLLWLNHLKNGKIDRIEVTDNVVGGGECIIRIRNQQKAIIGIGNNTLGVGVKTIVGGSEKMIRRIYAN